MNFLTVTIVIFIVALIGVFAVALIVYLSSLVKSAYQIKIEMRSDLEEGLKRADEEMNKRTRWIKREMVEDMEKIKAGMQTDIANRSNVILEESRKLAVGVEESLRKELAETNRRLNEARDLLYAMDHKLRSLRSAATQPSSAAPAETLPPVPAPPEPAAGPAGPATP